MESVQIQNQLLTLVNVPVQLRNLREENKKGRSMTGLFMNQEGLEPSTHALKGRCSTN